MRVQRARTTAGLRRPVLPRIFSWGGLACAVFITSAVAIAVLGQSTLDYAAGQRIDQPIYARVDFQVPDPKQTEAKRIAARAATPSYYRLNDSALTFGRIRADLRRLYDAAAAADSFEQYQAAVEELGWPASAVAYDRLRELVDQPVDAGRAQFENWVDSLPLENEYVVRGLVREDRDPKSATDYIMLQLPDPDDATAVKQVAHSKLVPQGNEKALRGSAGDAARRIPIYELRATVEAVVFSAFQQQPTIVFDQERTLEEARKAEEAVPEAMATYEGGKTFINPGVLGSKELALLSAEHAAYLTFLQMGTPAAVQMRQERLLQRVGLITMVALVAVAMLVYTRLHQPRIFEMRARTVAFVALVLVTLLAARLLELEWGHIPELIYAPCILAGTVLALVYPRRFALGATCIAAVLVTTVVGQNLTFLLTLFTAVTVVVFQLEEIRSRTKLITAGAVTAVAVLVVSAAGGFLNGHSRELVLSHALWAAACALLASFVVSGVLPFIEKAFRIATSLTLLEWRDPMRPLLQLLAREAPGTYNHSLVLGTLAEAACERIGANALLAQVGALYHDIGKIPKAEYFAENQEGRFNRHDNLAPTMSLLIILGHVKDGIEMAKEYKLPRVLHQFIEEHHGTTVVRYFHHVASEKQPHIASGKHDREVPEAEFRYAGPKPRSRESAVVMLCDGVESTVRTLKEPTVSRIEGVVHNIVTDRLNDGQFEDCDITLRELRLVEDSLVKSLCSIYHGRVAYPKAAKAAEEPPERRRVSV